MKKVSKRVLLALLTLVLSAVTLGTTTYAWFTVGNTVSVGEFEMNVQSGSGLEMTYVDKDNDEKGYVRNISTTDITEYLRLDYDLTDWSDFELDAVTSTDGKTFKKLNDSYELVDTEALEDKHFVEFKLRFRTKTASQTLVWNKVNLTSTGIPWAPGIDYVGIDGNLVEKGTEATYYAKNAARISLESGTIVKVFELPEETGVNAVLSNNEPNWTQGAHDFFQKAMNHDLKDDHSAYRAVETITAVTSENLMAFDTGADGEGYYYAEVTVRIYIEGFDSEMFNAILSNNIKVSLGFTIA